MLTFDCSERDFDSVVKSDTVVPWGGSAACGFNRTHYRALRGPLDRYSMFNSTKYEFDSGTTMFAEFSFASVDSKSEFEPVPFSSEDAFGGLGTKGYNIRNPFMPAAIRRCGSSSSRCFIGWCYRFRCSRNNYPTIQWDLTLQVQQFLACT